MKEARGAAEPPTMYRPVPQKNSATQNISCERPRSKGKAQLERERVKMLIVYREGAMDAQDGERESKDKRSNWCGTG